MVDTEYNRGPRIFKISIAAVIKNPVMLRFFPDCLKTEKDVQKCY